MSEDHFKKLYLDIVEAFDKDKTAIQFLRDKRRALDRFRHIGKATAHR